MAGRTV